MKRRFLARLAALTVLLAIYFSLEWVPLRRLLRSWAAFILRRLGHRTASLDNGSELLLVVDSDLYDVSANCTYADLFLVLAPFWWRIGSRPSRNLRRLVTLALAILVGNVARTSLALHLTAKGIPWSLAHTVPDKLIHSAAVSSAAVAAIRRDWDAPASG